MSRDELLRLADACERASGPDRELDAAPASSPSRASVPIARWRCGHARTLDNIKVVRNRTGQACLRCFRARNADYIRRKRAVAKNRCEFCGAQMCFISHDTMTCEEACSFSTGERAEWEWSKLFLTQAIEARKAIALRALAEQEPGQ